MPGGSLLLLLDDIASTLDDISVMTKVAAKKTAGVVGDDLALNAQQLTGVRTDRELSVVWAVAKGSAINKVILVPSALAISAFLPWLVIPLLMIGGAFLCFEGVEKLVHKLLHPEENQDAAETTPHDGASADATSGNEREKIRGAVRTDFILSAEIIVIALGAVAAKPFPTQLGVLTAVAVLMTVGVYGLVAGIVKLDDVGLYLSQRPTVLLRWLGRGLVGLAPYLMRFLSIAGTAAMFLVGGGILVHGVPVVHHWVEELEHLVAAIPTVGRALSWFVGPVGDGVFGVLVGAGVLLLVLVFKQLAGRFRMRPAS
jgi:predicted DNA repair protein MutK